MCKFTLEPILYIVGANRQFMKEILLWWLQKTLCNENRDFSWCHVNCFGGSRGCHYDGVHDDVIKWKHFSRYWPFVRGIHRWPVSSPHKGLWCGALMFSLICAWINGWVNTGEAGDLRRHCAHYDVTVMSWHHDDALFSVCGIHKIKFNHVYTVQYISRNMHTVLLWFALLWLCNRS